MNNIFQLKPEPTSVSLGDVGYFKDIPNEDYHAGPGISKSQLDLVSESPALLEWSKNAPEDERKKGALDMGTAVHTMLLEPHLFDKQYAVGPANAPRNTNAGKALWAEFEETLDDRIVITGDDYQTIKLMQASAMAHPHARWLLEAEGDAEASIYWKDQETDLLCRIRPDKLIPKAEVILDVKTTADISKIHWSMRDYRYDVQDAFYSEGYRGHFGVAPAKFIFLFISTTINCGQYPVRVIELDDESKANGYAQMRQDLDLAAACTQNNDWPGIQRLSVPPRFKQQ